MIIIPLHDTVLFPKMKTKIKIDGKTGNLLFSQMKNGKGPALGLTVKEDHSEEQLIPDSFYRIGTLLRIESILAGDKGFVVDLTSLERIETKEIYPYEGGFRAEYSSFPDTDDLDENSSAEMIDFLKKTIEEAGRYFEGAKHYIKPLLQMDSINQIMGNVLPFLPGYLSEKQELLEIHSLREKSLRFIDLLLKLKDSVSLQIEMAKKISQRTNKNYRDTLLREQLKAIQAELNENEETGEKKEGYKEKIEKAGMPKDVKKIALAELKKLEEMGNNNPESHIVRNYLDLLVTLPWQTKKKESIDIEKAGKILNEGHYGLEKVKERIIQHLAVMKLKQEKQGSILLLVGPPGTGKTSLGRSIAEALERKYVRISLGGIRDEAEIRGHRRTYIGALPGRIIQGMKKAGEKNPVFVFYLLFYSCS